MTNLRVHCLSHLLLTARLILSSDLKNELGVMIETDEIVSLVLYSAALIYLLALYFIFWKIQQGLIDGAMHNRSIVYMIPHAVAKKSKTVQR
jgi:hypothetical protein